jgi:FAD/FMN-containing dehydrogenase
MTRSLELDGLRAAMSGVVVDPAAADYDEARKVWNADVDRRPAAIARCASTEDVVAAVNFGRDNGLEIAVLGGGHSVAGQSAIDDGLMIDLRAMNRVHVDPEARRARVQGGALLGDLDAATQAHGLATPLGAISHTGVGGLTLGGGMGWLSRQAGLGIDNLVSAQVVVADGRVLTASAQENPDLFWAIRGGGGNFGVVTEFEFRLHEVGPMVQLGMLFWEHERGTEALRVVRDVVAELPDSCNVIVAVALTAPPAPFVPEQHHHTLGHAFMLIGFGPQAEHDSVLTRLRDALPPLFEYIEPMPYVAVQKMLDEFHPWGLHYYDKGAYLSDLSDGAINVLIENTPAKASPLSVVLFYHLAGAYCDAGEDDTAFSGGRSPRYNGFFIACGPTPELLVADRAWVRSLWDALRPHMISTGAYINTVIEEEDRIRASYGQDKYERLARIKGHYDPGNLFRRNANIKPI